MPANTLDMHISVVHRMDTSLRVYIWIFYLKVALFQAWLKLEICIVGKII